MFSGNTALLITDNSLQELLVDPSTGIPLSAGVVTFYHDNARTVLKNVFYLAGIPGAYVYTALPNPLTLGGGGTVIDPTGNDTNLFYYPYDTNQNPDPYYITIDNSNGQRIDTRQNWPFVPPSSVTTTNPTLRNLITNSTFWRNIGGTTVTTSVTNMIIAPSNHDGITNSGVSADPGMSDIRFIKSIPSTGSDSITFGLMPTTVSFTNDVAPEYYLNYLCGVPTTGETTKCIQIPLQLHLLNLNSVPITITFWAQNVGGNSNNYITAQLYQFLGSDQVSGSSVKSFQRFNLTSSWTQYTFQLTTPSASGLTASATGDDGLFIRFEFPLGLTSNINITKPCCYIGTVTPGNEFITYDQTNAVISAPRTGDTRIGQNNFYNFGWAPMNDGTIGSPTSGATCRANLDTYPLFNLLWNRFSNYVTGTTNPICQMYDSSGSAVVYGASAEADFVANKRLALTQNMGRVMMGTVPIAALLGGATGAYETTFTASSSTGLLITTANNVSFYNGMPITFSSSGTLPTGLTATTVYYVAQFNGATLFHVATSFANAMAGTVIAYTDAGTGTQTVISSLAGTTGGEYAHTQLEAEVGIHPHPGLDNVSGKAFPEGGTAPIAIVNDTGGIAVTTPVIANTGGTAFNIVQPDIYTNVFIKL